MDKNKRKRLTARGWRFGTAARFLQLTPQESQLIEIKLALSRELKQRRARRMTQTELAKMIGSSQPRIARAEAGHASVSTELLIRAMLATGASAREIGKAVAGAGTSP